MVNQPPQRAGPAWNHVDPKLSGALERAARAIARLDQSLNGHPLLPAFLYRARLEAVRRQAAVDGQLIDPWHLAAVLEGLRMRMDHELRIIDRGVILTGGGALLRGLDTLLGEVIGIPVFVAEDPMSCGAIGTGQHAILSR